MAKTQEELNQLKNEVEIMNKKLSELTEEELNMVTGGNMDDMNTSGTFELPVQLEGLCPFSNRCDMGTQAMDCCAGCSNIKRHDKTKYCALGYGYFSNVGKW